MYPCLSIAETTTPFTVAAQLPFDTVAENDWPTLLETHACGGFNAVVLSAPSKAQRAFCQAHDLPVVENADAVSASEPGSPAVLEYTAWQQLSRGARALIFDDVLLSPSGEPTARWYAARRVALFARTFAEILLDGTRTENIPTLGALGATKIATAQRGAVLFIENTDPQNAQTGSVFPAVSDITLAPQTILPWLHDTPIGASAKYLSAYAGIVKSDARVLTAHVRPDPFDGVRVYVYGAPGETAEIVLFNGYERAENSTICFADTPQVIAVGVSQIIALPTVLAEQTWFPADENEPVRIGDQFLLLPEGVILSS